MKYQQNHKFLTSSKKCMTILEALRLICNGPTPLAIMEDTREPYFTNN